MQREPSGDPVHVEPLVGPGAPLNAAADSIEAHGFVEQEFVIRGTASRYRLADPAGPGERIDAGHPYTTRLLVRRPRDPARLNGTVVVEWLNVSTGQDIDFVYAATRELMLREGYAWVGASVQRVGVEALVAWNAVRYGGLSVAAPLEDPATASPLDPAHAFTGAAGGDVLCWDLFSQVAEVIRSSAGRLLGLAPVERLIAAGESQAAFRLTRYFNSIQPLHRWYDGFLMYDRAGPLALRSDVGAKAISMGTEFLAEYAGASPQDADNQRWWELAGASHVSLAEMQDHVDPQVHRDGLQRLDGRPATLTEVMAHQHAGAPAPLWSRVPNGDLMKAALHALRTWLASGTPPPPAPRLAVDGQGRLLRDAEGRAIGGIRYAAYEVPAAVNVGVTDMGPRLAGYHLDFSPEEMTRRYGSLDVYLSRVGDIVEANVAQGFLLPQEAARVLAEARAAVFSG
jgi:Alpha/beta hydrolase domain